MLCYLTGRDSEPLRLHVTDDHSEVCYCSIEFRIKLSRMLLSVDVRCISSLIVSTVVLDG